MRPIRLKAYQRVADTELAAYCRERFGDPSITTVYNMRSDSWTIVSMVSEYSGIVGERAVLPQGCRPEHCPRSVIEVIEGSVSEKTIKWVREMARQAQASESSFLHNQQDENDERAEFANWMWRRDRSNTSQYDPMWAQL